MVVRAINSMTKFTFVTHDGTACSRMRDSGVVKRAWQYFMVLISWNLVFESTELPSKDGDCALVIISMVEEDVIIMCSERT